MKISWLTAVLLLPLATLAQQVPTHGAPGPANSPGLSTTDMALLEKPVVPPVPATDAAAVRNIMAQPGTVVLDVRTPAEYTAGHLAGARNVDFQAPDFARQVARLDKNRQYVLYCASGNRSGKAAATMRQQGFKKVVNGGGYEVLKK